jgi:hypothetical protein
MPSRRPAHLAQLAQLYAGTGTQAPKSSTTTLSPHKGVKGVQAVQTAILRTKSCTPSDGLHSFKAVRTRLWTRFDSHIKAVQAARSCAGDLARSIARDPCFPRSFSYAEAVAHVESAHGGNQQVLDDLRQVYAEWRAGWAPTRINPAQVVGDYLDVFPPRQNIVEAAIESGLQQGYSNLWFCWNDVPGSPTQGHFNGNRNASVALYETDQSFFCHQCGIWGYSDQLKARTWQGIAR